MLSTTYIAYIDPGTGSLLLQMVLATVMGAGVFFRKALLGLFSRGGVEAKPSSQPQPPKR